MNDDKWFNRFFALIVIVNLLLLGVGVWAVIELVQWVKTK